MDLRIRPSGLAIDSVILDMDGLMLDTEPVYKAAWQKAALELGYPLDDEFYLTLIGRTNAEGEAALIERFGAGFPLGRFRKSWAALWRSEAEANGIPHKRGLLGLLDYLATRRIPVGIATSSDQEYAAFSLAAAKLDRQRFACIVTGEQVANSKPSPDIYIEAARRLGVPPACVLAVEDSDAGILAAARAGIITVMIPDLKPPSLAARQAASAVLESLHDVISLMEGQAAASG
jgi:HAD superfamily hydrolase (TIGR01509 family)